MSFLIPDMLVSSIVGLGQTTMKWEDVTIVVIRGGVGEPFADREAYCQ